MGLLDALAVQTATGPIRPRWDDVARWLQEKYVDSAANDRKRRAIAAERIDWYEDRASRHLAKIIDDVFENEDVQKQRKALIPLAKSLNVTRGIIDETSLVYQRPARRRIPSGDEGYQVLLRALQMHEVMRLANRMVNLLNETLVWFSVKPDGTPRLELIYPDAFAAIPDPDDPSKPIAILLDRAPTMVVGQVNRDRLPYYALWDDEALRWLDRQGRLVSEDANRYGRIPGVLLHKSHPTKLFDEDTGGDITSAHRAVALLKILTLRLAKSQGERQPVLTGELARVASQQGMDGESPVFLPPEVTLSMLDSKTDPDHYLKTIQHEIASVARTYGMSYDEFMRTAERTTGIELRIKRQKLNEIRLEQKERWRFHEHEIARLMSDVLLVDRPDIAFAPDGLEIDFADPELATDPASELALLASRISLGLDNALSQIMRDNPDITDEAEAFVRYEHNLDVRAQLVDLQRRLNMPLDPFAIGQTPEQNGSTSPAGLQPVADGGPDSQDTATAA